MWSNRRWNAHYFLEQGFLLFFCPRRWLAVQSIPAGFMMCVSVRTIQRWTQKVTGKITHLELAISSLNCKLVCTPDNHSCKAFSTCPYLTWVYISCGGRTYRSDHQKDEGFWNNFHSQQLVVRVDICLPLSTPLGSKDICNDRVTER